MRQDPRNCKRLFRSVAGLQATGADAHASMRGSLRPAAYIFSMHGSAPPPVSLHYAGSFRRVSGQAGLRTKLSS